MDDELDLNDVAAFVRVVAHGGFAAAGRALGTPKSTLSKRIADLERSLGVRLIERSSRRFVVTDVGREFHRHAAAMLMEADAARSVVDERVSEPSGFVRLTASVPTAQLTLAPVLPKLARTWPKVTLLVEATDRFVDLVREGFDIGLRDHFTPLADSDLVRRPLAFSPNVLVASPAYLRRHGTPREPVDLAQHQGLLVDPRDLVWRLERSGEARVEATPLPHFFANEAVVLLEAARAGLGIACLPAALCASRVQQRALVRVLPRWTAGGVRTTLLMPERRARLSAVRVVADYLVQELGHTR
jgi:DNA-binding transcriptional LysR family regulator